LAFVVVPPALSDDVAQSDEADTVELSGAEIIALSLEAQNGTLCLNKTRYDMKKTGLQEYTHNCISAAWGTVDNTGRLMPIMLWQESSQELDSLQKLKVSKIQQWQTVGEGDRQCLCLKNNDLDYLCLKIYLPDDIYWHGTVFLAHSLVGVYNTCTQWEFTADYQICIPPDPTTGNIAYCVCAVKGQNNEDHGQLQLCEKDDPTSYSLMHWNYHMQDVEAYNAGIANEKQFDCSTKDGDKEGCKRPPAFEWCNWKQLQGKCALKPKFAVAGHSEVFEHTADDLAQQEDIVLDPK
jgi:hypothetical protein